MLSTSLESGQVIVTGCDDPNKTAVTWILSQISHSCRESRRLDLDKVPYRSSIEHLVGILKLGLAASVQT
jgi:hypothetical protein